MSMVKQGSDSGHHNFLERGIATNRS